MQHVYAALYYRIATQLHTFTNGWISRPFSISLTSANAVSIAETVSLTAGEVGCWSKSGVREFYLTIIWIIQGATVNHCRDKWYTSIHLGMYKYSALTFTNWWISRPLPINFTSTGVVSIAENVTSSADVVGWWSNCSVRELHLTIGRIIQATTFDHCRDRLQTCTWECTNISATSTCTHIHKRVDLQTILH